MRRTAADFLAETLRSAGVNGNAIKKKTRALSSTGQLKGLKVHHAATKPTR